MNEEGNDMRALDERPVCHRAEDLVAYLYGEASEADALDFRHHVESCEACSGEFAVFNQVHDSMVVWRNEALGSSFNLAVIPPTTVSTQFVRHERKLSAFAALREFFSVSPLWLRGATAFAALLLCALVLFSVSRLWRRETPALVAIRNGEEKVYTASDFKAAVAHEVKVQTERIRKASSDSATQSTNASPNGRHDVAAIRVLAKAQPTRLTRREREQLAADLRLTSPIDDEEGLFLPDQDQENPNY